MATTAAILDVVFRADTSAASRALRTYQASLGRTDKTITSTTRTTGALGKATRSTGTRLRSAAGYAASAAAAYLSIAQAKAAITTTQDLAKTTAGLNRNLGFTVKEGSRWAAVAKSRDIDAKALTMSFTTLSRRVVDAGAAIREGGSAAETAMAPFERLGISQREVVRGSKDLDAFMPRLADAFGDAAGGAERQASAQQLLGRGYATVLPLFADGAKGLQEQQKWADKYGTTLNEKTLKAQMDLVSAQRESKVAWLGIQMAFAQGVTPALEKANDVFQRIAAIMADKDLTDAEKWKKIGDIIGKWADKLLDVFVKVLPQLVERAAEAAPKIAGALIDGIMNSPAIGAFLLGGWMLKGAALGGIGRAAGALIGNPMGLAIAATAASAFAGAKLSHKLIADPDALVPMNMHEGLNALMDSLQITREHAGRLVDFMAKHPGFDTTESLKMMREQSQHTMNAIKDFGREWGLSLNEIRNKTKQNFQRIRQTMGTESMEAKLAVMHNFEGAVQAIRNSVDAGEISAKQGARAIHNVLIRQLKGYGISDPEGFINRNEAVLAPGAMGGKQRGGEVLPALATGGLAARVPGSSTGDRHTLAIDGVPAAKVESREGIFVGNRNLMATMEKANAMVPRFQTGGGLQPGIQALVTWAGRTLGLNVSSGLRPGDTDSFHGSGEAADFTPPSMGATRSIFTHWKDQLAELFYDPWGGWDEGQMIGAIGGHIDHIHAAIRGSGGGGPAAAAIKKLKLPRFTGNFGLGDVVATGLNNMAAGVESTMDKRLARRAPAAHVDVGGGVLSVAEFMKLANAAIKLTGASGFSASGLLTLAQAESGLDPSSQNLWDSNAAAGDPSGGLMQLTGTNFRAFHEPGTANSIFDPLANIAASINYQLDRYGGQVTHSPYMRGGLLGMLAEGGAVQWPDKLLGPPLGDVLQRIGTDPESEALQGLMGRIRGAQPNMIREGELLGKLFDLRQMADQNLEWAGLAAQRDQEIPWDLEFNAGKWNIMNEKGKAIESFSSEAEAIAKYTEMIEPLLGLFHGHTEQFWRSSELDNLWSLRKRLILAAKQMKERREQMHDALQVANEKKRDWQKRVHDIDQPGHTPGDYEGPDPNQDIKAWNEQGDGQRATKKRQFNREGGRLAGDREWRGDKLVAVGAGAKRVLGALDKIIPALETGEGRFNSARVELLNTHLAQVQGTGMSMRGLDNRPPVDELLNQFAGEINSSAFRLQELRADPRFTDTTEEVEPPRWTFGELAQFAQALRYGAFTSLGFAGGFAQGGFIPRSQFGLVGERGPEFISGPAQITPAAPSMPTPMIFADVYIGGEKIDERVQAEITGQKNSDNLRLRARHVQR